MTSIPKANDLIIFTNKTSAIHSDFNLNSPNYNWSQSIVTIEPNQSALVIDCYTIDNNKANRSFINPSHSNTVNLAVELTKLHKPHIPSPPTILVITLSNLLLEVLYDPDLIQAFIHPSNHVVNIVPSVYLMMAR